MVSLHERLDNWHDKGIGPGLQLSPAAPLHLSRALSQPTEELPQLLLNPGPGSQTGIRRDLLPCPIPYCLLPIEVRAVGWQGHQLEIQVWSGQILTDGFTTVGWAIVPNHHQGFRMIPPQLPQEGRRRCRRAVPGQFRYFHLSSPSAEGLPNNSWPSHPTGDWWSPPALAGL